MTIKPKGYYCRVSDRAELPILIMDADEIKEREALYVANTASSLRRKVIAESSKSNGHGPASTSI